MIFGVISKMIYHECPSFHLSLNYNFNVSSNISIETFFWCFIFTLQSTPGKFPKLKSQNNFKNVQNISKKNRSTQQQSCVENIYNLCAINHHPQSYNLSFNPSFNCCHWRTVPTVSNPLENKQARIKKKSFRNTTRYVCLLTYSRRNTNNNNNLKSEKNEEVSSRLPKNQPLSAVYF